MFASNKIDQRNFIEIVFEGRNKSYGAYALRKRYYRHVFTGLGISIGIVVFGLLLPYLIDLLKPSPELIENQQIVEVNTLPPPPGEMKFEYMQPKMEEPPKEVVPEVTQDSVIERKKEPKRQPPKEEVNTTDTGSATNGGGGDPNGSGESDVVMWELQQVPTPSYNWKEYLSRNLKYPEIDKQMNIQGKVTITTIFNADGTVREAHVSRGVSKTIDAEALRIVKSMPPWKPGIRNGHPVPVRLIIPINFSLKR